MSPDLSRFAVLESELSAIAARSLLHCHARGVHSIALAEGARIRLFYATPEHDLWRNAPGEPAPMSVGLHPHHCDVTLIGVLGAAENRRYENPSDERGLNAEQIDRARGFNAHRYLSALRSGDGRARFSLLGARYLLELTPDVLRPGVEVSMAAAELHTVSVSRGEVAAWIVVEGAEDPNYQPLCFSNAALGGVDLEGYYQPCDVDTARAILDECGLLRRGL